MRISDWSSDVCSSDLARFFWEQDQKKTLAQHAEKLANITFHEKLGTVADKVERVAKLAEWLANEGIVPNCDSALARQAAELAKEIGRASCRGRVCQYV